MYDNIAVVAFKSRHDCWRSFEKVANNISAHAIGDNICMFSEMPSG
jgi:hypothetical protein